MKLPRGLGSSIGMIAVMCTSHKKSGPGFPRPDPIRRATYIRPRCHRGFISSRRLPLSNCPYRLRNHTPVVNLVSNRALFDHAWWPHPSLGHGTVDNVPLEPSAMRTGKEAPILTQPGRLNRGQLHWRTASGALRTLALSVEHGCAPLSLAL
jgi:hypothetical protein